MMWIEFQHSYKKDVYGKNISKDFSMDTVKSVLPTLAFDCIAPLVDQVSDLILIITWLTSGHIKFAIAMTIPFLLNVTANFYHWWKWDDKMEKRFSWILVVLQLWPVYRALKIVNLVHKNDPNANKEKERFNKVIVSLEPYLESIPSFIVMIYALCTLLYNKGNEEAVIGDYPEYFYVNLTISLFTATFGLTKYLLNGPCRLIANHGYLDGILSHRFIHAYFAILFAKCLPALTGVFLALQVNCAGSHKNELDTRWLVGCSNVTESPVEFNNWITFVFFAYILVPSLILASCSIMYSTGCTKKFFYILLKHPQLILLAVFTNFTVGSKDGMCWKLNHNSKDRRILVVSTPLTIINGVMNLLLFFSAYYLSSSNPQRFTNGPTEERSLKLLGLAMELSIGFALTISFFAKSSCAQDLDVKSIDVDDE